MQNTVYNIFIFRGSFVSLTYFIYVMTHDPSVPVVPLHKCTKINDEKDYISSKIIFQLLLLLLLLL